MNAPMSRSHVLSISEQCRSLLISEDRSVYLERSSALPAVPATVGRDFKVTFIYNSGQTSNIYVRIL